MTTRERVLTLVDGGIEPHIVAAMIGLSPEEVAKTLAEQGYVPSPLGGLTKAEAEAIAKAGDLTVAQVEAIVAEKAPGLKVGKPENKRLVNAEKAEEESATHDTLVTVQWESKANSAAELGLEVDGVEVGQGNLFFPNIAAGGLTLSVTFALKKGATWKWKTISGAVGFGGRAVSYKQTLD